MSSAMVGICVTEQECSDRSGTASGNCASGFGVCCFNSVEDLTATITNNLTYIQNPGFPSVHAAVTTALSYTYTLQATADISQIRLDFHTGIFGQPDTGTGSCAASDIVTTVSAAGPSTNTLCGVLTGQHMYLESTGAATNANTVTITLPVAATPVANWKILVRMIEKGNPTIINKPPGCLQWYTGLSGQVTSLNYNNNGALGRMNDDDYKVCIRPEGNNNCVNWRGAGGTIDDFKLGATQAAITGVAAVGTDCSQTLIIIPDKAVGVPYYCGDIFSPANDATASGTVTSDEHYINVLAVDGAGTRKAEGSGFNLLYTQTTC